MKLVSIKNSCGIVVTNSNAIADVELGKVPMCIILNKIYIITAI